MRLLGPKPAILLLYTEGEPGGIPGRGFEDRILVQVAAARSIPPSMCPVTPSSLPTNPSIYGHSTSAGKDRVQSVEVN